MYLTVFLFPIPQFSDNGLVQFQTLAENEQYLFPSPSADGFPDDIKAPLLAGFWDDGDLTLGNGKLHYQVRRKQRLTLEKICCCVWYTGNE